MSISQQTDRIYIDESRVQQTLHDLFQRENFDLILCSFYLLIHATQDKCGTSRLWRQEMLNSFSSYLSLVLYRLVPFKAAMIIFQSSVHQC